MKKIGLSEPETYHYFLFYQYSIDVVGLSGITFRRQKIGRIFNFDIFSVSVCLYPTIVGDNYCDDSTNNAKCNFDGGDCCNNDNDGWNNYCSACECKDPSGKAPIFHVN